MWRILIEVVHFVSNSLMVNLLDFLMQFLQEDGMLKIQIERLEVGFAYEKMNELKKVPNC